MTGPDIPMVELAELLAHESAGDWDTFGPIVRVHDRGIFDPVKDTAVLKRLPFITMTVGSTSSSNQSPLDTAVDMVVPHALVGNVAHRTRANPEAAVVLTQLTRTTAGMSVEEAIGLESFAYAMLQAGREFSRWLAMRTPRTDRAAEGQVIVHEEQGSFDVLLDRPDRANAINARMRTELESVLRTLALTTGPITLRGAGRHFCAGGDLSEFGLVETPVLGHLTRMRQNLPASVARLADRLTVHVHGACVGAGMELSSFAGHVTATKGATWRLPEVSMGLLPGCGGTVSIPRRIGRQRTLLLALSDITIDVTTALEWGLIDEISH
jgi:hypothetical protein